MNVQAQQKGPERELKSVRFTENPSGYLWAESDAVSIDDCGGGINQDSFG